ncbi:MAG: VCBS repeat-containing protein [Pseudomonadota bacterium]
MGNKQIILTCYVFCLYVCTFIFFACTSTQNKPTNFQDESDKQNEEDSLYDTITINIDFSGNVDLESILIRSDIITRQDIISRSGVTNAEDVLPENNTSGYFKTLELDQTKAQITDSNDLIVIISASLETESEFFKYSTASDTIKTADEIIDNDNEITDENGDYTLQFSQTANDASMLTLYLPIRETSTDAISYLNIGEVLSADGVSRLRINRTSLGLDAENLTEGSNVSARINADLIFEEDGSVSVNPSGWTIDFSEEETEQEQDSNETSANTSENQSSNNTSQTSENDTNEDEAETAEETVEITEANSLFNGFHKQLDFNGDGKSDVLIRNSSTNLVRIHLMNGTEISESTASNDLQADPDYIYIGNGDFDGDSKTDLLWRHETSGILKIWKMGGITYSELNFTENRNLNYTILAIEDFDFDDKADILWQNTSTKMLDVWILNGADLQETYEFGIPEDNLSLLGIGEFHTDDLTDLIFFDADSSSFVVWRRLGDVTYKNSVSPAVESDTELVEMGDFNGNGRTDLVARRTSYNPDKPLNHGEIHVWYMAGFTITGKGLYGTLSMDWELSGVGDFDSDGNYDMLFRHNTSQEMQVWQIVDSSTRIMNDIDTIEYANAADFEIATLADYDGDSDVDILMWDPNTFSIHNWLYEDFTRSATGSFGETETLDLFDSVK